MGRKKGVPNKKTQILTDSLERLGLDPIEGLYECLKEYDAVTPYEPSDQINLLKAKASIYMELLQYIYPKRKAIEFVPPVDTTKNLEVTYKAKWGSSVETKEDTEK